MPTTAQLIEQHLKQTELKFAPVGDGAFVLPFSSERAERVLIAVSSLRDIALLYTPINMDEGIAKDGYYQLLRSTFRMDVIKFSIDKDSDLFLAAEVPVELLDPDTLEGLIRALAALADVGPRQFSETSTMDQVAEQAFMVWALHLAKSSTLRKETPPEQRLASAAQKAGVNCQQIKDSLFLLEGGALRVKVAANCRGHLVSFQAPFGDLRPARGNLAFYRQMARTNHRLNVTKLALDKDDDLSVMHEVPFMTDRAVTDMIEAINTGVEHLVLLADLL